MKLEVKTWLYDILQAINEIESFLPAGNKRFDDYRQDLKTKRAVERNLEIIGEAVKRVVSSDPEILISESRKIIDLRNKVIHGYDVVSDELVWGVILNNLPVLKKEVILLLGL